MSQVTLEYCGIAAAGRNVTEAKQAAARALTAMVQRVRQAPEIIALRGHAAMVWSDVDGYTYRLITDTESGALRTGQQFGCSSSDEDRITVIGRATTHLAQIAWSADIADDHAFAAEAFPHARAGTEGSRRKSELLDWMSWQRGYIAAKAAGLSDWEAHSRAREFAPRAE